MKAKYYTLAIVLYVFIFNITALRFIWGIESISRVVNSALLLLFLAFAVLFISARSFHRRIWYFYIAPVFLIFFGMSINLFYELLSKPNLFGQAGSLFPWLVLLVLPGLIVVGKFNVSYCWRFYNYIMFFLVSASLVESSLVTLGLLVPREIVTSGGSFLATNFSLFYFLESGDIHYRFYSCFLEPGTLGMFILPALAYSLFRQNYLFLSVYFLSIFLTNSLGTYIAVLLMLLLAYFISKRTKSLHSLLVFLAFSALSFWASYGYLTNAYSDKGESAAVRERVFFGFFLNFKDLILAYPFGLPRAETSDQLAAIAPLYVGSNFTLANVFGGGGFLALIGIVMLLGLCVAYSLYSLFSYRVGLDEKAAIVSLISLLTFIPQRQTIIETAAFGLLYSFYLIRFLSSQSDHATSLPFQLR